MTAIFVKETHPAGIRYIAYSGMPPETCLQLAKDLRGGSVELTTQPEYDAAAFVAALNRKI